MWRQPLARQHIQRGKQLGLADAWPIDQQMEKRVAQFLQLFRALVAVRENQDWLFRCLPGEHQVQRFGSGGEAGQREGAGIAARETGDELMESLLTDQRLEQVADGRMRHEWITLLQ